MLPVPSLKGALGFPIVTSLDFSPIERRSLSVITRCSSVNAYVCLRRQSRPPHNGHFYFYKIHSIDNSFRVTSPSVVSSPLPHPPFPHPLPALHPSSFSLLSPSLLLLFLRQLVKNSRLPQNILYNQESTWVPSAFTPQVMGWQECTAMLYIFDISTEPIASRVLGNHSPNWAVFQTYSYTFLILLLSCCISECFPSLFKTQIKSHLFSLQRQIMTQIVLSLQEIPVQRNSLNQ